MSTSMDPTPSAAAAADEVESAGPIACWSVRECDWRDQLPEEVVALLAPPVIVSAETFVPAPPASTPDVQVAPPPSWPDVDVQVARPPSWPVDVQPAQPPSSSDDDVPADYSPRHAAPEGSAPRFVPPTLARRLRRRRPLHAA